MLLHAYVYVASLANQLQVTDTSFYVGSKSNQKEGRFSSLSEGDQVSIVIPVFSLLNH